MARPKKRTAAPKSNAYPAHDLESRRKRAQDNLEAVKDSLLDDFSAVTAGTDGVRQSQMVRWKLYLSEDLSVDDPDSVWVGLCCDSDEAKDICRAFLRSFVTDSVQSFPILGPQEYEDRRTVNAASSVLQCWRNLIAQADRTVMFKKRCEERKKDGRGGPKGASMWQLKYRDHTQWKRQGPVYEISKWIFQHLAAELNLATKLTFDKVEVTSEDIIVLVRTLWLYSQQVPYQKRRTRLSIHAILLLAAIGGFRKSTILRVPYRAVALAAIRNPEDPSKTKLIATLTIPKNKQQRKSMQPSRATEIAFSLALIPYAPVCLGSLISACAVNDDAFHAGFQSIEELLSRPILEDTDYVPLKWKKDMLDEPIFEVSHSTLQDAWHQLWLVSGSRGDPRFHATRVAAGATLDGSLTPAVRNYILSNSTSVFEGSYQPRRVREDLTSLAFGLRVGHNDELFQRLRNMSLRRDAGAPTEISCEDSHSFEARNDVKDLRARIEKARQDDDDKETRSLRSQLQNLQKTLKHLQLMERREQYFHHVDTLRAQGLPTTHSEKESDRRRYAEVPEAAIAQYLRTCFKDAPEDSSSDQQAKVYMELLVDYLAYRPLKRLASGTSSTATLRSGPVQKDTRDIDNNNNKREASDARNTLEHSALGHCSSFEMESSSDDHLSVLPTCLLCCHQFRDKSALTRHYKKHVAAGTFGQPFPCPECHRRGLGDIVIDGGPPAWSSHVERNHGGVHAPNLPSYSPVAKSSLHCPRCMHACSNESGLTRHIKIHQLDRTIFRRPFPCPECHQQGESDTWIDGAAAWYEHVALRHTKPDPLASINLRKRARMGECESVSTTDTGKQQGDCITVIDLAGATSVEVTEAMSYSTQNLVPAVDDDLISKIDPRLLIPATSRKSKRQKVGDGV